MRLDIVGALEFRHRVGQRRAFDELRLDAAPNTADAAPVSSDRRHAPAGSRARSAVYGAIGSPVAEAESRSLCDGLSGQRRGRLASQKTQV
jgi:hypothetical protein